ncbi:sensor histidine kinase [Mycolicibacterium pulveris]|uniref:sensor histidine kinase n=1 Tax=Mycolicibacterium pulveris TaxID=36813 RepID=UPI003CF42F2F
MRWRPTVQGWQNLVLSIMGIVVLAGAIGVVLLLDRTDDASRRLTDEIQPARIAAYQLQAALRDQETAVRGYAIAADPLFLELYYAGQNAEHAAAQEIRNYLGNRVELLADLDAVELAAATWRSSYVEPLLNSVRPGAPDMPDALLTERGKAQFDALRRLFDTQNQNLSQTRQQAVDRIIQLQTWRDAILVVLAAAIFLTTIVLALLVRAAVTRPLDALARSCRVITSGNFEAKIEPRGPRDIRAIASDVEDMRQRIITELETTRSAQAQLAEQALELQRSNAELEQFAYVASHDLQEPLRKVAAFCQLLEKRYGGKLDERGQEYIEFAVDGAKRMQVLINDLLTFSRVGRLNATTDEVDLGDMLDTALGNLSTGIEETGAQIERRGEPLPRIMGDPTLLTMLWQNLIGNAVKFRREGLTPRIVVECEQGANEHDGTWLITVTDNGIGIPDEFVDKVFVIFQRLHGRDVYTGTGIGLALCKKIVEHHGGRIWIDTSFTGGTRFRFTIPSAVDEPVAATPEGTTQ